MSYLLLPPSDFLKNLVHCYYEHQREMPFSYYAMADVYPKLYFRYRGITTVEEQNGSVLTLPTAGLHGQRSSPQIFRFSKDFATFGVHLYPVAIPIFFGLPANEINDQLIDLQTLIGNEAIILENKFSEAKDISERILIVESFFLNKIKANYRPPLPVFNAIEKIIQSKGVINIKQLATDSFVSERQLERQFSTFGGLNPKLFARIIRFKDAIEFALEKNELELNLTEIAMECGYFDQSHFIHDFKAFSGFSPKEFFSPKSPVLILNH